MDNLYEKMKNRFVSALDEMCGDMTIDERNRVLKALDAAAAGYRVTEEETALTVPCGGVPEAVKAYLAVKKVEGMSEATLKLKYYRLKAFFEGAGKPIDKMTANDIRVLLYRYQQERGVGNETLEGFRGIICAFYRWAACEEYIQRDPTASLKPIKYEKKQRTSLTQIELEYIRKACVTPRERAMVEFMYSTGCRVSEMAGVKVNDVDFSTGEAELFGKGRKYRTSYLNAKAHVAITEYLNARRGESEYLFCTERKPYRKMGKAALEKAVKKIMARATEVKKNVTPHIFRHTTATQAVANGMAIQDVQALLGHSDIATTMVYVDRDRTRVKSAHLRAVV